MKTLITATEPHVDAKLDPRFGRGAWFCIYDHETGDITFVKNDFKDAQGGAGTRVAEKVMSMGVNRVISGDFGPKAKDVVDKFEIQLIKYQQNNQSIEDIISSIK